MPSLRRIRIGGGDFDSPLRNRTFGETGASKRFKSQAPKGDQMKFGNYEIRTDAHNWILKIWTDSRDKEGRPTGRRHCEYLYYPTLRDMARRVADLEAKKLVETAGMEIEDLAQALGEKLSALEDEIRAQCEPAKKHRAA